MLLFGTPQSDKGPAIHGPHQSPDGCFIEMVRMGMGHKDQFQGPDCRPESFEAHPAVNQDCIIKNNGISSGTGADNVIAEVTRHPYPLSLASGWFLLQQVLFLPAFHK